MSIVLRPITTEDTPLIVKWRNNPRVRNHFVFRTEFTDEMHLTWMREKVATGQVVQFIICEMLPDGSERPVGTTFLQDIDYEKKEADYGFLIGEDDAAGKGYAAEAIAFTKKYAKETMGLHALTGKIICGNLASEKSWKKAGAEEVCVKKDVLCSDGTKVDLLMTRMQL